MSLIFITRPRGLATCTRCRRPLIHIKAPAPVSWDNWTIGSESNGEMHCDDIVTTRGQEERREDANHEGLAMSPQALWHPPDFRHTYRGSHHRGMKIYPLLLRVIAMLSLFAQTAHAGDPFWQVLTTGKVDLSMRYRYEHVDDSFAPGGVPLKNANASTLRTALGYRTGTIHDFAAYLQLENVVDVGGDDFDDGSNGKTRYAAVIDPSDTEINEAYLDFKGLPATVLRAGRQAITYREAPFHRYIGTILWRQNWQTFDALSVENKSLPDMTVNYAYVWNVNRIFGEDAPGPLDDFDSNSHFVNIRYAGIPIARLEAYAYLLEFDNARGFSTQTYGARLSGGRSVIPGVTAIYVAEYAHQSDYQNNPSDIDANYFLGELGATIAFSGPIKSVTLKGSYELLGGDGGADRFVTILGTNHAFQGWADRFLVTPGDGIEDSYITFIADVLGAKFIAAYHMLSSDEDSYDYGDELDLELTRTFMGHYTLGLKYAAYDADANSTNLARNPVQAADVSKFWAFAQLKF